MDQSFQARFDILIIQLPSELSLYIRDCPVNADTYNSARIAAGTAARVAVAVATKEVLNGAAIVGHHSIQISRNLLGWAIPPTRALGTCLVGPVCGAAVDVEGLTNHLCWSPLVACTTVQRCRSLCQQPIGGVLWDRCSASAIVIAQAAIVRIVCASH
eukprot:scaffold152707_cov17-Tisochrysis_lutea.AAC.1